MKIVFYGGQTAGVITLLTLLTQKHHIVSVFPQDKVVKQIAQLFNLTINDPETLNSPACIVTMKNKCDLFICCHGKKILSENFVTTIRCINLHPCLYAYKGARP